MSYTGNKRIEVDYMEGYGEWFRLWTKSSYDAELLQGQCQEFLADLFGLDVSVQLFEVERSGCMVIVRWFYVEDIKEALDSVVYTEIGWKDMVFHTPEGESAYYLANYFKRILPIALFEVKKWGTTVRVTGKPYTMHVPYSVIDPCTGEVIIESNKEFELTFDLIERIEAIIENWSIAPAATSLYIIGEVVAATQTALIAKAMSLLGKEHQLPAYLEYTARMRYRRGDCI